MTIQFEFTLDATPEQRDAILEPLRAYNLAQVGDPQLQTFVWSLREAAGGAVVGGLYGRIAAGWMFIELLSVPEAMRGKGHGRQLMEQAEALARERGCIGIWLDTFSFQAPEFYRRLGFVVFGEINDYPPGHSRYFLQKRL